MTNETPAYPDNALRLSLKEWLAVGVLLCPFLFIAPAYWSHIEANPATAVTPAKPDRQPFALSEDYWFFQERASRAAQAQEIIILGDSVVWGEYTTPGETLSAQLTRLAPTALTQPKIFAFANLGINGLHPLALAGLIQHYGAAIQDSRVLLVLNTFWLSAPHRELLVLPTPADDAEADIHDFSVNHPNLLPQFYPPLPAYQVALESRLRRLARRSMCFFAWVDHLALKQEYLRDLDEMNHNAPINNTPPTLSEPRFEDHAWDLFTTLFRPVPPPLNEPHSPPAAWQVRGLPSTDFAWSDIEKKTSPQLRAITATVRQLQKRNNSVFILITPFNMYMMTPENRLRYEKLLTAMEKKLAQRGIAYTRPKTLPTHEYADASHPLAAGYARLARGLYANPTFRAWMKITTEKPLSGK